MIKVSDFVNLSTQFVCANDIFASGNLVLIRPTIIGHYFDDVCPPNFLMDSLALPPDWVKSDGGEGVLALVLESEIVDVSVSNTQPIKCFSVMLKLLIGNSVGVVKFMSPGVSWGHAMQNFLKNFSLVNQGQK